jgi:hypothetical protein
VVKPVKFARSARKHRIGRAHALAAINSAEPVFVPATEKYGDQWVWIARDDRGVELEIVGVDKPDCMLIIHVQPTSYEHQERP